MCGLRVFLDSETGPQVLPTLFFWFVFLLLSDFPSLMPNTHRRRRRDETVELRRVGGVNTPVGSRDPAYNFLS